jgi:hypothetical protein
MGVPLGGRTALSIKGGAESNTSEVPVQGGLDELFWELAINWQPNAQNTLRASMGERFFGTSLGFSWTRSTRYLTLSLDYAEDPTTVGLLQLESAIGDGVSGSDLAPTTTEAFISKRLEGDLIFNTARSTFRFGIFSDRREFSSPDSDEEYYGLQGAWEWQFGSRTSSQIDLFWQHREKDGSDVSGNETLTQVSVGLLRDLSPTLQASLEFSHSRRRDVPDDSEYDENMVSITISKAF